VARAMLELVRGAAAKAGLLAGEGQEGESRDLGGARMAGRPRARGRARAT
jgi:hypothetical protein